MIYVYPRSEHVDLLETQILLCKYSYVCFFFTDTNFVNYTAIRQRDITFKDYFH
jgi:hypothetical protein